MKIDDALYCEDSFVSVPIEEIKQTIKGIQKSIERDLLLMHSFFSGKSEEQANVLVKGIESSKRRCLSLKERVSNEFERLEQCFVSLQARMDWIQMGSAGKIAINYWNELKILRLIDDYLLREGCTKAYTQSLQLNDSLKHFVNASLFSTINAIGKSLVVDHDISLCLQWTNDNRLLLKRRGSNLEFLLRTQEFIELARTRKVKECLNYARKHLLPFVAVYADDLQRIMGLLAIDADTKVAGYQELYSLARWNTINQVCRADFFSLYGLPVEPPLVEHIEVGLAAIKTPLCSQANSAAFECPVCSVPFNEIAKGLPYAHHENSRIVCRITNKLIDANNPPMILPNGHVYSTNGIEQLKSGETIRCPITGDEFNMKDVRKCYFTS